LQSTSEDGQSKRKKSSMQTLAMNLFQYRAGHFFVGDLVRHFLSQSSWFELERAPDEGCPSVLSYPCILYQPGRASFNAKCAYYCNPYIIHASDM
jgi:hypothetical protein